MNFEIELKNTIKEKYGSVRAFAQAINTPYSTIDNIFKRGILGVSVQVVLKICSELNIDIEKIPEDRLVIKESHSCKQLNDIEAKLVTAYHEHPDMQPAVNKMLDIEESRFNTLENDIADELKQDIEKNTINTK